MSTLTAPQMVVSPIQRSFTSGFSKEAVFISASATKAIDHFTDSELNRTLEQRFRSLKRRWKADTMFCSSAGDFLNNPSYLEIISLGKDILPIIFSELQSEPDHWFVALRVITGVDPVPKDSKGNFNEMVSSWLNWGENNDYVSRV